MIDYIYRLMNVCRAAEHMLLRSWDNFAKSNFPFTLGKNEKSLWYVASVYCYYGSQTIICSYAIVRTLTCHAFVGQQ
jgi:hypothetical protein